MIRAIAIAAAAIAASCSTSRADTSKTMNCQTASFISSPQPTGAYCEDADHWCFVTAAGLSCGRK